MKSKLKSIIKKLEARDVKPIRVQEGTSRTDPAIFIDNDLYIQVGVEYVMVFSETKSGRKMYESSHNIKNLLKTLKQAIHER